MAAVGAAPFAGAVAPYNITATELQDAAFVQEASQVMIWLASVSPAIRNHASLRLPIPRSLAKRSHSSTNQIFSRTKHGQSGAFW